MKRSKRMVGAVLVLVIAIAIMATSCATAATTNGIETGFGVFTMESGAMVGRQSIAEYKVILGLVTSGYADFVEATKGQDVEIVTTNLLGIITTYKAVPR